MIDYAPEEKHKAGGRIDMIKVVNMILVSVLRGNGTKEWPYRHETLYYDMDGNLKWVDKL